MSRTILHDAALADGSSDSLRLGVSLAIADGRIESIGANDEVDRAGAEVIDAGGAVIVPAMVDCHSHLTMQGGSHWIERGGDPPPVLRQVARENAKRPSLPRHAGGELLGIDHAGRIEKGMPADLVLVHGDPLSDARALWRVWAVFQGGTRVA